jgi:hypothetical protein
MRENWISSGLGKLLEEIEMPHVQSHGLRPTADANTRQMAGGFRAMGDALEHTPAGIGASLGLSMNYATITTRHADMWLEREKEALDLCRDYVPRRRTEGKEAEKPKPQKA